MRMIIGCERSGIVRDAFRKLGHDAYSCDIVACEGDPTYHIQGDILDQLDGGWDAGIFYPDCTYLTVAAEWCYKDNPGKRMSDGVLFGAARREARDKALDFVEKIMRANIYRICIENPVGCIGTRLAHVIAELGFKRQIIQPHQFGEDASKATCLFLKNLPFLVPTKHIAPRWVCCGVVLPDGVGKYGCPNCLGERKPLPRWANQTDSGQNRLGPSESRAMDRARTYRGVADAKAEQWGSL